MGQRVVNSEFRVGSNQRRPQKSKPPSKYTVQRCAKCAETHLRVELSCSWSGFELSSVFLCSSRSCAPGFLPFLFVPYYPACLPFKAFLSRSDHRRVVSVVRPMQDQSLCEQHADPCNIIVVHISSFVLTTPINFISTISIADFLGVLLPFYNPSSGSLRLLLLLLLPALPTPLRAILGI